MKSCLTQQFLQDIFLKEYEPTIQDSYRKQLVIEGEICQLDILDVSGNEEFRALDKHYLSSVDGFLIVFALDNAMSFSHVSTYRELIKKAKEGKKVICTNW